MKTAIVHEWLISYAGSEKVLAEIVRLYPDADLYSLLDFLSGRDRKLILNKHVSTSFIQKLPFAKRKYRGYLPLMPYAIKRFDLSGYDLIITSSHTTAKGIRKDPSQLHICYCHTPMRYIWDMQNHYLQGTGLERGVAGTILKMFFNRLRKWDVSTAKTVDYFIANSHFIKNRIKRAYGRDAEVIYPPVDIKSFQVSEKKENFFLAVSRMVPYKRVDLIVEAFSEMGLPLIVIGDGPDYNKVKRKARKNVELMGYLEDDLMRMYMQKARALVFAAEEDFGIVPVEAQASGTPVIAFGRGGVTETVIPFQSTERKARNLPPTGIFFNEQKPSAIMDAVKRFEIIESIFNPHSIRKNAEKFSKERFEKQFRNFVSEKTGGGGE